jgi:hypothetical protein
MKIREDGKSGAFAGETDAMLQDTLERFEPSEHNGTPLPGKYCREIWGRGEKPR